MQIPRLCHVGGVSDVGACRLCLVEVEGQRKLRRLRCTAVARRHGGADGHRRGCRRSAGSSSSCCSPSATTCARSACMNGDCELQDLAAALGIDHVRLRYQLPQAHGRHQPRALRHGPEPLRAVHALHPGVRRGGRRAHLGPAPAAAPTRCSSRTWASPGASRRAAPVAASACRCARPARCSPRARAVAEMQKDRRFLKYIVTRPGEASNGSARAGRSRGWPRSGWAAARAATCRSWTWTSGCSTSPQRVEIAATPTHRLQGLSEPVDITLVEGAVANEEHLEHIRHVRRDTKRSGRLRRLRRHRQRHRACATLFRLDDVLDRAYRENVRPSWSACPSGQRRGARACSSGCGRCTRW